MRNSVICVCKEEITKWLRGVSVANPFPPRIRWRIAPSIWSPPLRTGEWEMSPQATEGGEVRAPVKRVGGEVREGCTVTLCAKKTVHFPLVTINDGIATRLYLFVQIRRHSGFCARTVVVGAGESLHTSLYGFFRIEMRKDRDRGNEWLKAWSLGVGGICDFGNWVRFAHPSKSSRNSRHRRAQRLGHAKVPLPNGEGDLGGEARQWRTKSCQG